MPPRFGGAQVGLRCLQLCLGASGLGARVGVIQNEQQLAFLDGVAFFDKNALHTCCDRSVRFEIVDGLDFSVGGNQAADGALLDNGGSHRHGVIAAGDESGQHDTAAKMASAVTHQRRGWRPELFPFNGMQGKAQASMYHHARHGAAQMQPLELTCLDACA